MKQVTFYISDALHAFAAAIAEEKFGQTTKEYLSDLISDALIEMKELSELPPIFPIEIRFPPEDREEATDERQQKFDLLDELEEDPGGGMRRKSDRKQSDDLDDDIPF